MTLSERHTHASEWCINELISVTNNNAQTGCRRAVYSRIQRDLNFKLTLSDGDLFPF